MQSCKYLSLYAPEIQIFPSLLCVLRERTKKQVNHTLIYLSLFHV